MKRYLLSVMLCVAACVSAWAQTDYGDYTVDATGNNTWTDFVTTENVAKIFLKKTGVLKDALNKLAESNYSYDVLYISGLGIDTYAGGTQDLDEDDLQALASVNVATLDLQNLVTKNAFTFANGNVKRVILPDKWDKSQVKAAGETIASVNTDFEACLSQNGSKNGVDDDGELVAYVKKPGTLHTAMLHTFFSTKANNKLGSSTNANNTRFSKIKYAAIMGYPSARDYSNEADFDPDGHFVPNVEADETTADANSGVGGVERMTYYDGTKKEGALFGTPGLIVLDLSDAVIYEEFNADLTLSWTGALGASLKQVWIPTSPLVKTLPADFLSIRRAELNDICIPGNIEYIRTRAFSGSGVPIRHIWTTGTDENVVYDNGAVDTDGNEYTGQIDLNKTCKWGTYTFPANLKLIESNSFSTADCVKDVYVLSVTAPECHVDAFNTNMYIASDAYEPTEIKEGVISRDAYTKGNGRWMTMLHYPRECTTPDIQRYTDPTREFSIATGLKDGKGGTIYFPNRSEYLRAYRQGTYGYVWYAWNPTRSADGNNAVDGSTAPNTVYSQDGQIAANAAYTNNTYTDVDKTDRVFYDTTDGGNLDKPAGQKNYWEVIWEDKQLYPLPVAGTPYYSYEVAPDDYTGTIYVKNGDGTYSEFSGNMESGVTYYKRVQEQDTNADGSLKYAECTGGDYVAYDDYIKNDAGAYVKNQTVTENNESGKYVKEYSWVIADPEEGMYVQKFTQDKYNGTHYKQYEWVKDSNGEWKSWTNWDGKVAYGKIETWESESYSGERYSRTYIGIAKYADAIYAVPEDDRGNLGNMELKNGYTEDGIYYNKVYSTPINYIDYVSSRDLSDEPRYDIEENGYRNYNSSTDEDVQRYAIVTKYRLAGEGETGNYCPVMVDKLFQDVTHKNDYRGWHQFVLTGYATNSSEEFVPYRSYITDNDWWTICLPLDLTYDDMRLFFGDKDEDTKIPYLSKLTYVVRDYGNKKITLMFSKNLMEYKETVADGHVHGTISTEKAKPAGTDVVLHKGVPYLIRPYLKEGASRQFDIKKDDYPELYQRLLDSETLGGSAMNDIIYKGEYTVPAFVVNDESSAEGTVDSKDITMKDGTKFSYSNGTIKYRGEDTNYKISEEYDYTFVGSFFLSLMPQYSYFLGWDSTKKRAAFWYNKTPDTKNWTWNNETGIICANFNTSLEIDPATGLEDPARWIFGASDCNSDDLKGVTGAKSYVMDFGGDMSGVIDGISLQETDDSMAQPTAAGIYNLRGMKVNTSRQALPKGIYIVNGKKYVVK